MKSAFTERQAVVEIVHFLLLQKSRAKKITALVKLESCLLVF